MDEATQNRLFCQIIGHLLIADGLLTDKESAFMSEMFDNLNITEAERGAIIDGINIDADVDQRLGELTQTQLKLLIDLLKEAASVDGDVVLVEQSVIARVHAFLIRDPEAS